MNGRRMLRPLRFLLQSTMHIRRAAVPAASEQDTPSSSLALLPVISISVLVLILLFLSFRLFRRSLHLPTLTWLRGKGQGAKSRLGLSNVELLPTSVKSVGDRSASPYNVSFNFESNTGKDRSLLSRTSSLDDLPQFVTEASSPPIGHTRRSKYRSHFKLPTFLRPSSKSLHRRSKSLGVPVRNREITPPSSSFVTGSSAPSTPSSQPLLIDFSNSSSSTSSDLGSHKFPSGPAPLIPGIPIPASSPTRPSSSKSHTFPTSGSSRTWAFDDDDTDVETESEAMDPLVTAFRRISQPPRPRLSPVDPLPHTPPSSSSTLVHVQAVPTFAPQRVSSVNPFSSYAPSSPTYATQQPLSPSPISLSPSPFSDIQLVPIKSTSALPRNPPPLEELVGLDKVVEPTMDSSALPTLITTSDPLTISTAGPYDVSSEKSPERPTADVPLDPFDDVNAITLVAEPSVTPHLPTTERPLSPLAETTTTAAHDPDRDVESLLQQSPTLTPIPPELVPAQEVAHLVECDPLASSWNWDDAWGTIPSPEAPQNLSESLVPAAPPTEAECGVETLPKKDNDLITFDQDRDYTSGVDYGATDPVDAWFVEEPTAVWETGWVEEEVKDNEKKPGSGLKVMEDKTVVAPFPEQITVVRAELVLEKPDAPIQNTYDEFNDHNDINDTTLNAIDVTIKTSPVDSLLSTPVAPTSPHNFLPPHTPPINPTLVVVCSDPELLPLPDLPPPASPSALALSPQLAKPNSPTTSLPLAQTPTPPASPPPIFYAAARLPSPSKAADASSPVASAALIGLSGGDDAETKTTSVEEREIPVDVSNPNADSHVDVAKDAHGETQVVDVTAADCSLKELLDSSEKPPTDRQASLSTDLPGSFPSAPEPSTSASISLPAPAHLSLLPRVVASTTKAPSNNDTPTTSSVSQPISTHNSSRLRPPRSALDLALAMQLRPGLGAGADPAWMVRFLMALFGWVAMLASGEM